MENGQVCKCTHHKVVPLCIILIGLTFLLGQMNVLTAGFVAVAWPVLLIIIGIVKMAKCKCC